MISMEREIDLRAEGQVYVVNPWCMETDQPMFGAMLALYNEETEEWTNEDGQWISIVEAQELAATDY